MMMRTGVLAAIAGSSIALVAFGQDIIRTQRLAQGDNNLSNPLRWGEVAVIASPIAPNEAAVVMLTQNPGSIWVVTTLDYFEGHSHAPVELAATTDPIVASSARTGAILVGGCGTPANVYVYRKLVGSDAVSEDPVMTMPATAFGVDKPLAAIGPWPSTHNTPEVMHVAAVGAGLHAWAFHSKDEGDVGTVAPGENDPGYPQLIHAESNASAITYGDGAYPLVVPSGPHAGRLIIPYAVRNSANARFTPAVTYTDTAGDAEGPNGRIWEAKQLLATYGASPGSTIYTSYADEPLPSGAFDPTDPNTVYVAFIGSTSDEGPGDIFVAKGITLESGALQFTSDETVRITDAMIRPGSDEGQTDETKVSLVIDSQQGVNLLYSRRATEGDGKMVVRYARWASFQSLKDGDAGLVQSLSGEFDPWEGERFDYQMMCLAGCHLYAAYPTNESGTWDMYVSVIRLNTFACQPDPLCYVNCDDSTQSPILNVADFTCFITRFAEGSALDPVVQLTHYSNCDHSTNPPVLNVADFSCFLQKFAAGCE